MNEPTPDVLHWYPMRVTYSRELQTKSFLESVGVECFIPMRYEQIDGRHPRHQELRPAIHNLIFVHASQSRITEMKMTRREKPGQRVRVVDGDFAGVEGIIKRVKKNKRVVVQIEHVAAVAIAFLPSVYLEPIE